MARNQISNSEYQKIFAEAEAARWWEGAGAVVVENDGRCFRLAHDGSREQLRDGRWLSETHAELRARGVDAEAE